MCQRQHLADPPRPAWHPLKRKHEARQQHRREIKEDNPLHSLHLAFRQGRERKAEDQIGTCIDWRGGEQGPDATPSRQTEEQLGEPDNHHPCAAPMTI